MDTRKLEDLSLRLAREHGMTQEEAASLINSLAKAFVSLVEAFEYIAKALSMVWKTISESIESAEEFRDEPGKQKWIVHWDTRRRSQVMSNKPRFWVRKIIR